MNIHLLNTTPTSQTLWQWICTFNFEFQVMKPKSRVASLWKPSSFVCVSSPYPSPAPEGPFLASQNPGLEGYCLWMASSVSLGHKCCCSPEPVSSSVTRRESSARFKAQSWKAGRPMLIHTCWALNVKSRFCCPFLVIGWEGGIGACSLLQVLCAAVEFQEPSEGQSLLLVFHWSLSENALPRNDYVTYPALHPNAHFRL